MPWHVEKRGQSGRPYKVVRSDTGKVVGSSKTRAKAEASKRARYGSKK